MILDCMEFGVVNTEERLKRYRRYVYEAGAVDRSEKGQRKVIDDAVVKKEQKREYEIKRIDRFRYRTRYFTDSGIIGTKEFVSENYHRFKDVVYVKAGEDSEAGGGFGRGLFVEAVGGMKGWKLRGEEAGKRMGWRNKGGLRSVEVRNLRG